MKKTILVSACLLGEPTRYDGQSRPNSRVSLLLEKYELIPVCPEVMGGLPTPRTPSERVFERVLMRDGRDVTEEYERGAALALERAVEAGCTLAILKERSPSCGFGKIYDGSFSGKLTDGNGVAAELLSSHGIRVIGETSPELDVLLSCADKQ